MAEKISTLSSAEREIFMMGLSPEEVDTILWDWRFWARPEQVNPVGDWAIWMILAGRGFGKTRSGSEWIRENVYPENSSPLMAAPGSSRRIALVGETAADVRDVMVKGNGGILQCHPPKFRPRYIESKRALEWPNGTMALCFSAEDPEQLRGPEHDTAWCLTGDTLVLMADGTERKISDVQVRDKVATRYGTRDVTAAGITGFHRSVRRLTLSNGNHIDATEDHEFYVVDRGFVPLQFLKPGDPLCVATVKVSRAPISVASVENLPELATVYNLTVADAHEFFAGGVLVHNCDELAKWRYSQETWDMLQFGMRLGDKPRQLVTTTPRPIPLVRRLLDRSRAFAPDGSMLRPDVVVTRGSTFDNLSNLAAGFIESMRGRYEGTRLGRQELNAEILDDVPGALWTRAMLEPRSEVYPNAAGMIRGDRIPDLARVVVGVDPSGTSGEDEDNANEIGIVVAALGVDGAYYVIEDGTVALGPAEWGRQVVRMYEKYAADRIVGEINYGGAMVEHTIRTVRRNINYRGVSASRGKVVRAEPIAALYEQGRVRHIGAMSMLEDQMCSMASSGFLGRGSPDRVDALVWALTDLAFSDQVRGGSRSLSGHH